MSAMHTLRGLAFRLRITPAPVTQSESSAILRTLQNLGPVSSFQIHPQAFANSKSSSSSSDKHEDAVDVSLVFARNTRKLADFRGNAALHKIFVTANENIPDASIKDPYNVRGLKYRKPDLKPREFVCSFQDIDAGTASEPFFHDPASNHYSGPFAVDRTSVFVEILAKTDCPSGLIHGLLPRLEHESQMLDQPSAGTRPEDQTESSETEFKRSHVSESDNLEQPGQVSLGHGQEPSESFISDSGDLPSGIRVRKKGSATRNEQLKSLSKISLMQMYRDAITEDRTHKGQIRIVRPS